MSEIFDDNPPQTLEHRPRIDWRMKKKIDQQKWDTTTHSPSFINKPLRREHAHKLYMRKIQKEDFDWKDTAILTQFMNKVGKIKNRYKNS
jgi:ribosomal protein S18